MPTTLLTTPTTKKTTTLAAVLKRLLPYRDDLDVAVKQGRLPEVAASNALDNLVVKFAMESGGLCNAEELANAAIFIRMNEDGKLYKVPEEFAFTSPKVAETVPAPVTPLPEDSGNSRLADIMSTTLTDTQPADAPVVVTQQSSIFQGTARYLTVELAKGEVSLSALKSSLRHENITPSQVAAQTKGKYASTDVTAMLSGREPMAPEVVAALDAVVLASSNAVHDEVAEAVMRKEAHGAGLPDSVLASMRAVANRAHMAQATATVPIPVPSFARTMAQTIKDPDNNVGVTPPVSVSQDAVVSGNSFPLDLAFRLGTMIRKGNSTSEITATFSLRKLQSWAKVWHLLTEAGCTQREAVSGGFHMAVAAKTYGEELTFVDNAFNTIFGYKAEQPKADLKRFKADGGRHPMSYLVEPLLRANQNLWLAGDTGTGKTHMVKDVVKNILNQEYIRIQATGDMNVDDLLGGMGGKNGTTFFEYGALPIAMGHTGERGMKLIIDEGTTAHADVLFELQAVLEGDPLVLKKNRGEVIHPKEGFCVVICDNTIGLGERPEYIGTKVMNESFRDRFHFLRVEYMPEAQEKAIMTDYLKSL